MTLWPHKGAVAPAPLCRRTVQAIGSPMDAADRAFPAEVAELDPSRLTNDRTFAPTDEMLQPVQEERRNIRWRASGIKCFAPD
jgi:hypothetical protein